MKGPPLANLLASPLVELARASPRSGFLADIDVPVLIVSVDSAESELATALLSTAAGEKAALAPSIGFRTRSPVPGSQLAPQKRKPLSPSMLERRLARGAHVAIPLRKRAGAGKDFSERISVGRAMNNDVVLRTEGVSKFHAWFVCDEEQCYYAVDAGSRNGTTLNGVALDEAPSHVEAGDILLFGGVEALVSSAEIFWDTLAGRL
jgi:hypothetical protein